MPFGYGLAWELMTWAKENGAKWFDFGGISAGTASNPDDVLGGISDFKRYFSREKIAVGHEWLFETKPIVSRVGRALSEASSRFR